MCLPPPPPQISKLLRGPCKVGFEPEVVGSNPTGDTDLFSFSVLAHFLSRAIAQKVLFGTILEHFNLPHLNHYHIVLLFYFSQREVTTFDYDIVTGKIVNKRQAVPIDESYGVSTKTN